MHRGRRFSKYIWGSLIVLLTLSGPLAASDLAGSLYLDNLQMSPVADTSLNSSVQPESYSFQIREERASNQLTLKMFPKNLGRNFKSLFSTQNLVPLLSGAAISGASAGLDDSVQDYFGPQNPHTLFSDTGARAGRPYVLAPAIGALFLTGLHSDNTRFKSFSYALAQGYVLDLGITQGLKEATGRPRPDGSNSMSFPSGHSTDGFMIATVVDQFYGHKAGFAAYGLASLLAASRLKSNVHWLSDVTAGATIGYIIGRTVSRNIGGLQFSKHVQIAPAVNPFEKQYGFAMSIKLP